MMLSIVTINYNDCQGLERTLNSVSYQKSKDIEHIIIDGGSTDCSKDIIKAYAEKAPYKVLWVSEPDKGIYNAMNKGIRMATGNYIQILNSGDVLATDDVVKKMICELEVLNISEGKSIPILYGNMIKDFSNGKLIRDTCGSKSYSPESFLYFYLGTLNHDCAYIRRDLFEKYGYYNEDMKICSDWEWYVRAIILGKEKTYYTNIDVTIFDMFGVSESDGKNRELIKKERREYLESIMLPSVLRDYDAYSFPITQYLRLKRYHLYGVVYFMERVLFKFEKWGILK